jgi:hypothetical protein
LEGIWKEKIVEFRMYFPGISSEGLRIIKKKIPQSGQPVTLPRIERDTYPIQFNSVTFRPASFGAIGDYSGNNRSLFWESHETKMHCVEKCRL